MRLIDADELNKVKFHELPYTHIVPADLLKLQTEAYERGWNDAIDAIMESAPTIDAVPARHGHWIVNPKTQEGYCSECKFDMPVMMEDWHYKNLATEYCPSCGAKMYEEEP